MNDALTHIIHGVIITLLMILVYFTRDLSAFATKKQLEELKREIAEELIREHRIVTP